MREGILCGSPLPRVIGLRIRASELVRCMVGRDVLAETVEDLQTWRSLEDEPSEASCLVVLSFASTHWPWQ